MARFSIYQRGNSAGTGVARTYQPPRLYDLTKGVQTRLPREVRDMIYAYLLTTDDIFEISRCSPVRLDRYPYLRGQEPNDFKTSDITQMDPPAFVDRKLAYAPFTAEVIEMMYELYRDFWIDTPTAIPSFLDMDFFGSGSTPRQARISCLHVSGLLDPGEPSSINLDTLASDFQAILNCHWAPKLDIDIAFRSELAVTHFDCKSLFELAKTLHRVWQTISPIIDEAEGRGARIYFVILTKHGMNKRLRGGENDMLNSEEEWSASLDRTLGYLCRGRQRASLFRDEEDSETVEERGLWRSVEHGCYRSVLGVAGLLIRCVTCGKVGMGLD